MTIVKLFYMEEQLRIKEFVEMSLIAFKFYFPQYPETVVDYARFEVSNEVH